MFFKILLHMKKTAATIRRRKCLTETTTELFIAIFLRDRTWDRSGNQSLANSGMPGIPLTHFFQVCRYSTYLLNIC